MSPLRKTCYDMRHCSQLLPKWLPSRLCMTSAAWLLAPTIGYFMQVTVITDGRCRSVLGKGGDRVLESRLLIRPMQRRILEDAKKLD